MNLLLVDSHLANDRFVDFQQNNQVVLMLHGGLRFCYGFGFGLG